MVVVMRCSFRTISSHLTLNHPPGDLMWTRGILYSTEMVQYTTTSHHSILQLLLRKLWKEIKLLNMYIISLEFESYSDFTKCVKLIILYQIMMKRAECLNNCLSSWLIDINQMLKENLSSSLNKNYMKVEIHSKHLNSKCIHIALEYCNRKGYKNCAHVL